MNIFSIFLFLLIPFTNCTEIEKVRIEFHKIDSKESLYLFLNYFEGVKCDELEPYIASAIMSKAKHTYLPLKKMRYFDEGKKRLEVFIKKHPDHIEARYVRVLIQSEIPKFLNYHENLKKDITFIVNNISQSGLPIDYQNVLLNKIKEINL